MRFIYNYKYIIQYYEFKSVCFEIVQWSLGPASSSLLPLTFTHAPYCQTDSLVGMHVTWPWVSFNQVMELKPSVLSARRFHLQFNMLHNTHTKQCDERNWRQSREQLKDLNFNFLKIWFSTGKWMKWNTELYFLRLLIQEIRSSRMIKGFKLKNNSILL